MRIRLSRIRQAYGTRDQTKFGIEFYENYEKLFPQHFPSVRVRSVRNNTSVVEEHIVLGDQELVIMAKHVRDEPVPLSDISNVYDD